jgi:hypothetical protein
MHTGRIGVFGLVGTVLFSAGCVGLYREFEDLAPIADIHLLGPELDPATADEKSAVEEPALDMFDAGAAPGDEGPSSSEPMEPRALRGKDAADAGPRPANAPTQDSGPTRADGGLELDATIPDAGAAASERRDASGDVGGPDAADGPVDKSVVKRIVAPPLDGTFDYQMGKSYPPAGSVKIVVRAHTQARVEGNYNICELSGFRVHGQDRDLWLQQHPELILRDGLGTPVVDKYSSLLVDIRTEEKRAALAAIIGEQIASCAIAGFDAVAINDLDAYAESQGRINAQNVLDTMKALSGIAHTYYLAVGQKNASELAMHRSAIDADFAVAEECNRYDECDTYRATYGDHVLVIEYRLSDFEAGCRNYPQLPIALRDVDLVAPDELGYLYAGC